MDAELDPDDENLVEMPRDPTDDGQLQNEPGNRMEMPRDPTDDSQLQNEPGNRMEMPRDPTDDSQLQNKPGNRMEMPRDPTDDSQLQNEPGNHMEMPRDPTDDSQLQNEPGNRMEMPRDPTDDSQLQNEAENCVEMPRDPLVDRPVARRIRNNLQTTRDRRQYNRPVQQRQDTGRQAQQRNGWHWNRIYPRGAFAPQQIRYTGEEKILQQIPRNPTVEDFFRLYITEDIIDHVVTQTNLYARQYLEKERNNLRPHSLAHQWTPTDRAEILTFLAVLILMGIFHKPRLTMYWSKETIMATPIFNQVMRRDRCLLLLRFLHFADNTQNDPTDPNRDRLFKLRKVVNMIKENCGKVYSPGKNLSMDESLVLFKGRLSFKQYITSKRARFGIKPVPTVYFQWNPCRLSSLPWKLCSWSGEIR